MDTVEPNLIHHALGKLKGEVPTKTLEAYRQAGAAVYEALMAAESRRAEAVRHGATPWTFEPSLKAQLLCTWNAFTHQVLGDRFLEADYAHDPLTKGYVPAVTAKQARSVYDEVEHWLNLARQAATTPDFQVPVSRPVALPAWAEADPCPRPHLAAMMAALAAVHEHADMALAFFIECEVPEAHRADAAAIVRLHTQAASTAEYTQRLMNKDVGDELHERIEKLAQQSLEAFFQLGQLLAEPLWIARPRPSAKTTGKTKRAKRRKG